MAGQIHRAPHRRPKDATPDPEMAEGGVSEEGKWSKTEVGTPPRRSGFTAAGKHLSALRLRSSLFGWGTVETTQMISSQAAQVAIGINREGRRCVLAVEVANRESASSCLYAFASCGSSGHFRGHFRNDWILR